MEHAYRVLTTQDRSTLRVERVRALEADLFRAELAFEDALSNAERESLAVDIEAFRARLEVQYRALGILEGENESHPSGGELEP